MLEKICTQKFKAKVDVQEDQNLKNQGTLSLIPRSVKISGFFMFITGFGVFVAISVTTDILWLVV